jgi:hypothetical protein
VADKEYWVRLKPRNERKGIKLRRYMVFNLRFEEEKRWYVVPQFIQRATADSADDEINIIDLLREVRNDNDDPDSPLAFDICTKEEAKRIDIQEKKDKEKASEASNPHPVDMVSSETRRKPGRPKKEAAA